MNVHKNARLAPLGRAVMISRIEEEGWPVGRAAEAAGVSRRTAWRWLSRFRAEGEAGLNDLVPKDGGAHGRGEQLEHLPALLAVHAGYLLQVAYGEGDRRVQALVGRGRVAGRGAASARRCEVCAKLESRLASTPYPPFTSMIVCVIPGF